MTQRAETDPGPAADPDPGQCRDADADREDME